MRPDDLQALEELSTRGLSLARGLNESPTWSTLRILARVVVSLVRRGIADGRRMDQLEKRLSALVKRQSRKGRAT